MAPALPPSSLPLPAGFFEARRPARLSEELRRQYIEFAEASLRKVFALSDSQRNSWIPLREKKGVAVYRNFGALRGAKAHKSNVAEVAGKGELAGSLAEVGRAYAAHDGARFRRLMKKLHPSGGGLLDAAALFTVVPCAAATPFRYIGVKWFALKTPTPLVAHRDYCCLEVTDKIVDSLGNEMLVRVLSSIDVGEACPSLEHSHGLVRAKMLAGFMYRADRADPGVVRVHHVLRFDPGGYFPAQWAFKLAESQLVAGVVQLRRLVDKQQMAACAFVDRARWVPDAQRSHCAVCARAFGPFRPRHHCRACGEVICGKCSVLKRVDVPGTTLRNVRICSACNLTVQHGAPTTAAAAAAAAATSAAAARFAPPSGRASDSDAASDHSATSFTSSSTLAHNERSLMDLYMAADAPDTPSASSDASTTSNLSMRSTASTQSAYDARARDRRGLLPPYGTARGLSGLAPAPRAGLFPEPSNTPRSYIANNLTPLSGKGFGSGPVTPSSDASSTTPSHRAESPRPAAPLDLAYLRDTVALGGGSGGGGGGGGSSNSNSGRPAAASVAAEDEEKAASPPEPKAEPKAEPTTASKAEPRAEPTTASKAEPQPEPPQRTEPRARRRRLPSRPSDSGGGGGGGLRRSLFGGIFSARARSSSVDLPRSSVA